MNKSLFIELLLLVLFILPAVFAVNQFPDTTSKSGIFITAYGESAAYNKAFLANNFDVVVEPLNMAKQIHENNPNVVALRYRDMNLEDTASYWFDDWHDVNKQEEMFHHGTDPAGMSFVPANQKLTIYWQPDKRNTFPKSQDNSFNLSGYNIYRSINPDTGFAKLNSNLLTRESYIDTDLTNDATYYYKIKSVDTIGNEYGFSHVKNSKPTATPPSLILANVTVAASTGSDHITTFNFSVLAVGNPISVKLYIDLYNTSKHTIDANEIVSMNNAGNGIYTYSLSLHLPDMYKPNADYQYKSGYAFYIQASDGTNTIRSPTSGNYTTNINNRIKSPSIESFLTDPGNVQWKNHYFNYIKNKLNEGYDGLYIDSALTGTYFISGGISDALPENFNSNKFRDSVKNFIAFMKQNLGSVPVMYNGLIDAESGYSDITGDYLEVPDAALDEEFVYSSWRQPHYFDENMWRTRVDNIIKVDNMGKGALLVSHADRTDTQGRMFSFASYFIVKGKKTYFYYAGEGSYLRTSYFPEWRISLGRPLESYTTIDGYKKQSGSYNYYQRRFENGTVFVNPGNNNIFVELNETYSKVEVTGGLVSELDGNGALSIVSTGSLNLQPHSGAIVLYRSVSLPPQQNQTQQNQSQPASQCSDDPDCRYAYQRFCSTGNTLPMSIYVCLIGNSGCLEKKFSGTCSSYAPYCVNGECKTEKQGNIPIATRNITNSEEIDTSPSTNIISNRGNITSSSLNATMDAITAIVDALQGSIVIAAAIIIVVLGLTIFAVRRWKERT